MNLAYTVLGSVTYRIRMQDAASILSFCMERQIPYTDFETNAEGISLTFRLSSRKTLEKWAESRKINLEETKKGGLPVFLFGYRFRFGLMAGMLISVFLVIMSGRFVRDISVVGNERISTASILEMLEDHGFSVGCYIPDVNTDKIENSLLKDSTELSWISINILGGKAEVQVREYENKPPKEPLGRPANLIAGKSGIIEEVRIYQGKVTVKAGDYVEKGDLIVSGLYDSERVGFRCTRANGSVLARTTTEYFVNIPFEYEGIEYTGEEYCDKYLIFFDYLINISKNCGKEGALYDKIDIVEDCRLPGGAVTPIEIHTVKYSEYKRVKLKRSKEEAEELAYLALSEKLSSLSEDSVLLKKSITPRVSEEGFSLYCVVVAIEDIAEVSEFDVDMKKLGE